MNDLISRQAAIDAVGYYSLHSGDKLLFADKPLKELPSAQHDMSEYCDRLWKLAYERGKNERLEQSIDELRAEAKKHGYRLQKIPDYDCHCYCEYPNTNHRRKNGTWKCVDRYEPSDHVPKRRTHYSPITYCRKKGTMP